MHHLLPGECHFKHLGNRRALFEQGLKYHCVRSTFRLLMAKEGTEKHKRELGRQGRIALDFRSDAVTQAPLVLQASEQCLVLFHLALGTTFKRKMRQDVLPPGLPSPWRWCRQVPADRLPAKRVRVR